MCVIFVCEYERPSEKEIEAAFKENQDGAGIAWREEVDGQARVKWEKGLDMEEIVERCLMTPLPFIAHFRKDSCGTTSPNATHPFPIEAEAPTWTSGSTPGDVIFHNGHWRRWEEQLLQTCALTGVKLAGGIWTDTRAMAYLGDVLGRGFLYLLDEKIVIFGPDSLNVLGRGWSFYDNRFQVSNKYWEHRLSKVGYYDQHKKCWIDGPEKSSYHTSAPASLPPAQTQAASGGAAANVPFGQKEESVTLLKLDEMLRLGKISKRHYKKIKKIYLSKLREKIETVNPSSTVN